MFSHLLEKVSKTKPKFKKRPFLTREEEIFFQRLKQALPQCLIFPKVSLSNLLEVFVTPEKKQLQIQQTLRTRLLDFVVFSEQMQILLVVLFEENPSASDGEEWPTRRLLQKTGIKQIRWNKAQLPSYEQILRSVEDFSELDAAKLDSRMPTPSQINSELGADAEQIYSLLEHGNPNALSLAAIERMTPDGRIKNDYPHIWQKICLFSGDPDYLKQYLESLFIQNRPTKRQGLPKPVADEVIQIQNENARFVISKDPVPIWDPNFLHR